MGVIILSGLLQTERLHNGHRKLLRDLVIEVDCRKLTIPKDTETDFSSIPHLGRMFLRWSRVDLAGVVHDWMYHCGKDSRSEADKIWRMVALSGEHRANFIQAWVGWALLRLFGWVAWNKCRSEDSGLKPCCLSLRQIT